MAIDAIVIKAVDNVATALRDIAVQENVVVSCGDSCLCVSVREAIQYGHKFALRDIGKSENIIKYGEVIGRATAVILAGAHAHIQNIESLRGRGDLDGKEKGR